MPAGTAPSLPAETRDQIAARGGSHHQRIVAAVGAEQHRERERGQQQRAPIRPSPAAVATRAPAAAARPGRPASARSPCRPSASGSWSSRRRSARCRTTRCWLVSSLTALVSDMPGSSTISDGDDHRVEVERRRRRLATSDRDRAGDHAGDRFVRLAAGAGAARPLLEHADQQADEAGGGDVEPRQPQQPGDARPRPVRNRSTCIARRAPAGGMSRARSAHGPGRCRGARPSRPRRCGRPRTTCAGRSRPAPAGSRGWCRCRRRARADR